MPRDEGLRHRLSLGKVIGEGGMGVVPDELRRAVDTALGAREARDDEVAALAERGREENPEEGRKRRAIAVSVIGVVFAVGAVAGRLVPRRLDYDTLLIAPVALVAVVAGVAFWFRKTLLGNRFNRRAASLVISAAVSIPLLHVGSVIAGADPRTSILHAIMIVASAAITAALVLDRRFAFSAAFLVVAYFFASRYPEWHPEAFAAGELSLVATAAWIWGGKASGGKS